MFWHFHQSPRAGEVYNAGGGVTNSISVLEAIQKTNEIASTSYNNFNIVPENRIGDHIWYVSDLTKFQDHYPKWKIQTSLDAIIERIVKANNET